MHQSYCVWILQSTESLNEPNYAWRRKVCWIWTEKNHFHTFPRCSICIEFYFFHVIRWQLPVSLFSKTLIIPVAYLLHILQRLSQICHQKSPFKKVVFFPQMNWSHLISYLLKWWQMPEWYSSHLDNLSIISWYWLKLVQLSYFFPQ